MVNTDVHTNGQNDGASDWVSWVGGYDLFRLRDSGLAIKFRGIRDSNRVHGMQYRTKTILRDMENDLIFSRDTGSTLPDRSPQISEVHKKQRTLNIYTHDLFVFEIMFIHKNLHYLTVTMIIGAR